jgi:hypothetical protein
MLSPMEERVAALARECCNDAHGAAYDLSTLRCLLPTAPLAAPSLSQQAYTPPPPSKIHQPCVRVVFVSYAHQRIIHVRLADCWPICLTD